MTTVILDYGIGNLRSVQKAFEKAGAAAEISGDPLRTAQADRLVLPGVGAMQDCLSKLRAAGLEEGLRRHVQHDKPFLGICVGMQMLFERGFEGGEHRGLGILPGDVVRFPEVHGYKIPHMGWNEVSVRGVNSPWSDLPQPAWFYFVHSYYCAPRDESLIALETEYVVPFCAAIQRGRLLATQFHPEKSQRHGLYLLHKFITMR